MATNEIIEIVATAVDRATPVLARVQSAFESIQQSSHSLDESSRRLADSLRRYNTVVSSSGVGWNTMRARQREIGTGFRELKVHSGVFSDVINRHVIPSFTRIATVALAAFASLKAFKDAMQRTSDLTEFARSTGLARDQIRGMMEAGEEFAVPAEKTQQMLGDMSKHLQEMRLKGQGDFFKSLFDIKEGRKTALEMSKIMKDVDLGLLTNEEGQRQAILKFQEFIRTYREMWGEASTKTMLTEKLGLPADWANFARVPLEELTELVKKYAASVKELDPEQVERFWAAWRGLSRVMRNFTTAVLNPLLPKLTDFFKRLASDEEAKTFAEKTWPKIIEDIETAYTALKAFLEGQPIDWGKVFGIGVMQELKADFTDFINQLTRTYHQIRAKFGLSSQKDIDEARKEELRFRVRERGTGTEQEMYELEALERGATNTMPRNEAVDKANKEWQDRILKRLQEQHNEPAPIPPEDAAELGNLLKGLAPQQFAGTGEQIDVEKENTRALRDMTEEVKRLNTNFLRGIGAPAGEAIEGFQEGGEVQAGQTALVGEGGTEAVASPSGTAMVGQRGPEVVKFKEPGAVIPNSVLRDLAPPSQAAVPPLSVPGGPDYPVPPTKIPTAGEVRAGTAVAPRGSYGGIFAGEPLTQLPGPAGSPLQSPFTGKDKNLSGLTAGTGVASVYGTLPGAKKGSGEYYDVGQDKPGSARIRNLFPGVKQTSGLPGWPEEFQGIALGDPKTLGSWHKVTMPDGREITLQQTDTGTNILKTGKLVDMSAAALGQLGYKGPKDFSEGVVKVEPAHPEIAKQKNAELLENLRTRGHISEELYTKKRIEHLAGETDFPRQMAGLEGRQEGGLVSERKTTPIDPDVMRRAKEALKDVKSDKPGELDWRVRINRALESAGRSHSEFENAPGPSVWEGGRLPGEGEIRRKEFEFEKKLFKYEGYYDRPDWLEQSKKIIPNEASLRDNVYDPGALNRNAGDGAQQFETTGGLNVTVRAPRGTIVKADGTGPFENVSMTRKMTEGADLGAG
jgi:hypothetical protein